MRIVLMGMPGVGKGTQAVLLRDEFGLVHISTGDILRDAVQTGSELGQTVRNLLASGSLVPDEVIGDLIGERLRREDARPGFILDGFPRTTEQVEILDGVLEQLGVALDRVVLLEASEEVVVDRLSGRRICPDCGAVFHVSNRPPTVAGVCDRCESALVQRPDDSEGVVRERLEVFRRETSPIAGEYELRGLLERIDGTGGPEAVLGRLKKGLGR